jgi:hypothetical protein
MRPEEGMGYCLVELCRAEGIALREAHPHELLVDGALNETLREALRANKLAVLAELIRRQEWGDDYAADWRSHCRRDWGRCRHDSRAQGIVIRAEPEGTVGGASEASATCGR